MDIMVTQVNPKNNQKNNYVYTVLTNHTYSNET